MINILFWIIFILLVFSYVFKLFLRYGLPWLLKRFVQNQQNKYSDPFNSNSSQRSDKEGEVKVKKTNTKKSDNDKEDFGEYVDFEDIK